MARPVVIDTDGGVDDAVALWWALTDPALDVVAITVVWGNVDVEIAASSVLRVVHAAGRDDVPVAVGARARCCPRPICAPRRSSTVTTVSATRPAPRHRGARSPSPRSTLLARLVRGTAGRVELVTLGPLTNIGVALHDHPEFAGDVAELAGDGRLRTPGR